MVSDEVAVGGFVGFVNENGCYVARPFNRTAESERNVLRFLDRVAKDETKVESLFAALLKYPVWESFTLNTDAEVEIIAEKRRKMQTFEDPFMVEFTSLEVFHNIGIVAKPEKGEEFADEWITGKLDDYFVDNTITVSEDSVGYLFSEHNSCITVVRTRNTPKGFYTKVSADVSVTKMKPLTMSTCYCSACTDDERTYRRVI